MSTWTVNPGTRFSLVASIELVGEDEQFARDRATGRILELAGLLKAFRENPDDPVIGWVRVTIEPVGRL